MLTFALFGAGRIGRIHARNVASQPRARLKYVVDPNGAVASELAAAVGGAPAQSEAVFDDPDVDAIVIASSAETHAELIMRAIESRKAIFCEKPIERSTERTRACARSLHEAGSSLFLGFQRRFDPSFAALHRCLADGEIGRPELVVLTSRDPAPPPIDYIERSGGLFRELMVHDFDVARWLLGEEPTEVYAVGSCLVDPRESAPPAVPTRRSRPSRLRAGRSVSSTCPGAPPMATTNAPKCSARRACCRSATVKRRA